MLSPEVECRRAVGVEYPDAIKASVRHRDPTVGAKGDIRRTVEAPRVVVGCNCECKRAVWVEDLHLGGVLIVVAAIQLGVNHGDPPVGADGDGGRVVEPLPTGACRSNIKCERAVWVEDLDAVVVVVGHGDHARQPSGRDDRGGAE